MPDAWDIDRVCKKCGHEDCKAQAWGSKEMRISCSFCGYCWTESER